MGPTLGLCLLQNFESLEVFLKESLGLSGQKIKSSELSKKQLQSSLSHRQELSLPIELINWKEICPTAHQEVSVLCETINWLALHKPAGVHTHPHGYDSSPNLVGWLATQPNLAPLINVNSANYDRGALWRLDLETSGVVVMAKNTDFYNKIRTEFSTLVKKKYYLAIVEGTPQSGQLIHKLLASEKKGRKMIADSRGQEAHLKLKPLMSSHGKTVVLVELDQGLRHQIRAQLSCAGFPILGDTLYGGAAASRLFLHSYRYEFLDSVVVDKTMELFGDVVDLNSLLQMLSDMGL